MKMLHKLQTKLLQNKATSVLEYAIFIIIIVLALVAVGDYLRRGISGKWKSQVDSFGFGRQYEPF